MKVFYISVVYMKLFKIYRGGILKDVLQGILQSVLYRVSYRVYAIQGVRGVTYMGGLE